MGSEDSFKDFPQDLLERIKKQTASEFVNIQIAVYPAYETFGNNQRQVQKLMDWLLLNASTSKYQHTFLLAHSMGGLLASDAVRYLYKLKVDEAESSQKGLISRVSEKISSIFSYSESSMDHHPDDIRFLVNVSAVITFDSPFFGLHQNVLTRTGMEKGKETIKDLPDQVKKNIPTTITRPIIEKIVPDTIGLELGKDVKVPVSTTWIKSSLQSTLTSTPGETETLSSLPPEPAPKGTTNINLTEMAVGSGAVVTLVGPALALPAIAGPVAVGIAATFGNRLVEFYSFLHPLTCTEKECLDRILVLFQEHYTHKRLYFSGLFNVLPSTPQDSTLQQSRTSHKQLFTNPELSKESRTFCVPPHEKVGSHFKTLPSPLDDEIDAHMWMFDRQSVGGEHYDWLLDQVILEISQAIAHLTTH